LQEGTRCRHGNPLRPVSELNSPQITPIRPPFHCEKGAKRPTRQSIALLANSDLTLGTSVRWNLSELPYLTVWKNTAAQEDGYVTGIEPATGYPFNRKVEPKYGRVPMIQPGETRSLLSILSIQKDVLNVLFYCFFF
jgi:hypothetical protein